MRDVVRDSWLAFTEPLEGGVPYLYADIRNLITIAFGNLCDPLSSALSLPLMHPGGIRATQAEITADWLRIKGDPRAAARGHLYARGLTTLRLTREGMTDLALGKLASNDAVLRGRLPDFEDYPACAQMALHSLSWACGPGYHFPKLMSAVVARDWDAASIHIQMREVTPEGLVNAGLRARNKANRTLMLNAARVDHYRLDPDTLSWTEVLGISDTPTLPDLSAITAEYDHTPVTHTDAVVPIGTVYPKPRDPGDDAA